MVTATKRTCHRCLHATSRVCDLCLLLRGVETPICADHAWTYPHPSAPPMGNIDLCTACNAERTQVYVRMNRHPNDQEVTRT